MHKETVREELNELLETSGITAKHISKTLGWDYSNFIKFKAGQFDYGEEKVNQLGKLIREYKEAMKSINH